VLAPAIVREALGIAVILVRPASALAMLLVAVREVIVRPVIIAENQTIAASLSRFAK